MVGNAGAAAVGDPTILVDTSPPVLSVAFDESLVVAPAPGAAAVTVQGDISVQAGEAVTMPSVKVGGKPVATWPRGEQPQSPCVERTEACWELVKGVFGWADEDMDGYLSFEESRQWSLATRGADLDEFAFRAAAQALRVSADVGFSAEDLGDLYASSADWVGALHTDYSILVGFSSERSAAWEFTYDITAEDFAGELGVEVTGSRDAVGNVGAGVTAATAADGTAAPLHVQCAAGYWGVDSPCAPWTECTATQHTAPILSLIHI